MATTVWKGQLTFGLVSIPVRLFRAARAEKVSLHQLHRPSRGDRADRDEDHEPAEQVPSKQIPHLSLAPPAPKTRTAGSAVITPEPVVVAESESEPELAPVARIRQTVFDPVENMPVPRSELVRGYEYAKGQYAVVEAEDLRGITPKTSSEMQIVEFVRFSDIDPVFLETSYYLAPDEAGERAYALLFEGMRESGYAALAQVAMQRREHVMILRPGKKGIITHTMFYPDEVRSIQEFRTDVSLVTPKELNLAKMLIDTLAAAFDPAKFKDTYRERLRQLIEAKVAGKQLAPVETPTIANAKVVDIMDALQKSLAALSSHKAQPAMLEQSQRKSVRSERPSSKKRQRA